MQVKISQELESVLLYAREEAIRTGFTAVGIEHLLLGVIRHSSNAACNALKAEGIDLQDLKDYIDSELSNGKSIPWCEQDDVDFDQNAMNTVTMAMIEAGAADMTEAGAAELLLAISRSCGNPCHNYLDGAGISHDRLGAILHKGKPLFQEVKTDHREISIAYKFGFGIIGSQDQDTLFS